MGALMRTKDWAQTPAGAIDTWPQSLCTTLGLLLNSKFPMFLWWGPQLVCFYNDAYRPSLGENGKHPFILGTPAREAWPEIWDFIYPLIRHVIQEGESIWRQDQLVPIFRNGKMENVYWTFSYSPVITEHDAIGGVLVVCNETTAKVQASRQLEEAYTQYSFAIDAAELGTWDLNPVTNRFTGNARLKSWFGLDTEEEISLQTALDVIFEKDRPQVTAAIQAALQKETGGHYDIEYTIIHPVTKEPRIVKAKGRAYFDKDGQPCRFNGTLQDITAEVHALEQVKKLNILVENSVDLMAILQMDGTNAYINDAGKALLGIEKDADVTKIPITDFHTPEQFAFVSAEIIPNVMSKGRWSGQFAIKQGGTGEIIPLYNNCHRIDDNKTGEPVGIGTVMRDMRPELNARQILEEKVAERTRELKALNIALEQKNAELASFNFIASHDMQEPLRKISTFISMIEREQDKLPANIFHYFERIKLSVTRVRALIKDLLAFSVMSEAEAGFEETNVKKVIDTVINELADETEKRHALVEVKGNFPQMRVIPYQFSQLMVNLIGNALKFSKPGQPPVITIEGGYNPKGDSTYCIAVKDNGIGFKHEHSEEIFQLFRRLHTREEYEGTGIGLSICKKVIENHHGFITVESEPGIGTSFFVHFPLQ